MRLGFGLKISPQGIGDGTQDATITSTWPSSGIPNLRRQTVLKCTAYRFPNNAHSVRKNSLNARSRNIHGGIVKTQKSGFCGNAASTRGIRCAILNSVIVCSQGFVLLTVSGMLRRIIRGVPLGPEGGRFRVLVLRSVRIWGRVPS